MANTHNSGESYDGHETEELRLEFLKTDRKNSDADLMDPGWRDRKPEGPICVRIS